MEDHDYPMDRLSVRYQRKNADDTWSTINHRLPSLSEIKVKIPKELFRSSTRKSMFYVTVDIFLIVLAYILMVKIEQMLGYGFLFLPVYWYAQGTLYMALFSIGHDCAHVSFSNHSLLNDSIGLLVFTWILIPYYPWKITHKNHHKNTANMDKDEAYYPKRGETYERSWRSKIITWAPSLIWFHYLLWGYSPRGISHFNPFESVYAQYLLGVSLSLSVYAVKFYLMFMYSFYMGVMSLIVHHIVPLLVFATYLVIVTLLHHTEMNVPWFVDEEWSHVKGQLSTVDHHYGHVHSIIHSIGTHQIPHLFPKIPHYHLEEATAHFRKAFPDLVRFSSDRILTSFVRMSKRFVQQRNIAFDINVFTYSSDQDDG